MPRLMEDNVEVFHNPEDYDLSDKLDIRGEEYETGWYYWFAQPGCLPTSNPMGPYENEQTAIDAAREEFGPDLDEDDEEIEEGEAEEPEEEESDE